MTNRTEQPDAQNATATEEPFAFAELWRPSEGSSARRGPELVLLDREQITVEQLQDAHRRQQETPSLSVLDALVQAGAITRQQAMEAVAAYFDLPFLRVEAKAVDPAAFERLPLDYIKAKHVLPVRQEDDGRILVCVADPADIFLLDDVKRRLRARVKLAVTPAADIDQLAEELSSSATDQVEEIIKDIAEDTVEVMGKEDDEVTDLEELAGESPVIRYVNYLISSAVREGASDIHIEPGEDRLRVRCRVDGVLFEQQAPPAQMHAAIVSRLKIMANLNIAERRLPQDGRIRATVHGRHVELRVSTLPVAHGEKCVIRILDTRSIMVGLEQLGMEADTLNAFRKEILQPHGIVLVTGPTGSGKTTTLYSALRIMDGDHLNISTVEEPVEYELDFANQVNVLERIGLTFAAALRSLLRQDPDIIMLGEIRDEETARIAVQASLTGHLVLSTLHTNDAPSSITRLINIGIEPYLISAAVNAVLAQRLVRRVCQQCRTEVTQLQDSERAYLEAHGADLEKVYRGAGCEVCRQTGYKGRVGVYEMLELTDEMRDLITSNPTLMQLRRSAREAGMRALRDDGLAKVAAGLTTVEEVMRVTET